MSKLKRASYKVLSLVVQFYPTIFNIKIPSSIIDALVFEFKNIPTSKHMYSIVHTFRNHGENNHLSS